MAHAAAILTVDLGAVAANWRMLSRRVAPARCGAVVKADAYGLGAARVAGTLLRAGCRDFFVALVSEGIQLLDALGDRWPADARLYVLNGPLPGDEPVCVRRGLVPVLNSLEQVRGWQALARQTGVALPAAIQVDTGMARLGLPPAHFDSLCAAPQGWAGIAPTLLISHLVAAEDPADSVSADQLRRFEAMALRLPSVPRCLANSSGIFLGPGFHFDLARPGAALYGVAPVLGQPNPMRPVVRLRARLIQWRDVLPGQGVGYNHIWHATEPTRVGTVAVGYADGYLRSGSNRARLRLNGAELRVIGRVSMDSVTVDLRAVPAGQLVAGAWIDVIDAVQDIDALAAQAGTNAYEILTSLGCRYLREYLDEDGLDEG